MPSLSLRFGSYRFLGIVYGAENVTSGASSDIRKATRTAQAMVKVSPYQRIQFQRVSNFLNLQLALGFLKARPRVP